MSRATALCRPVEWPTTGPLAGHEQTYVYPGSVKSKCEGCNQEIWVGPRQQALMLRTAVEQLCFECGIARYPGGQVQHLGNPYNAGRKTHE